MIRSDPARVAALLAGDVDMIDVVPTADIAKLKEKWGEEYQFHLAGTGPFMLKEYVPNDHVTMVRNPDYAWASPIFHQGVAYLDEIEFRFYGDPATRAPALESGEVDVMGEIAPVDAASVGVAMPKKIDPRTEKIRSAGKINPLAKRIFSFKETLSSRGRAGARCG